MDLFPLGGLGGFKYHFFLPLPQAPPFISPPFIPLYFYFFLLLLTTLQFSFLIHVPVSEFAPHRLGERETIGPGITNEALDLGHTLISRSCSHGLAKWALTPSMLILIYRNLLRYKVLVRKSDEVDQFEDLLVYESVLNIS